jgi:hypothetical protein
MASTSSPVDGENRGVNAGRVTYPDFLWHVFVAKPRGFDATARETDGYELGATFREIAQVLKTAARTVSAGLARSGEASSIMNPNAEAARRWYDEVWRPGGESTVQELMAEDVVAYMEGADIRSRVLGWDSWNLGSVLQALSAAQ